MSPVWVFIFARSMYLLRFGWGIIKNIQNLIEIASNLILEVMFCILHSLKCRCKIHYNTVCSYTMKHYGFWTLESQNFLLVPLDVALLLIITRHSYRDVGDGWAGRAIAHPSFGRSFTGKYFSEALILASTNPQYDKILFIKISS